MIDDNDSKRRDAIGNFMSDWSIEIVPVPGSSYAELCQQLRPNTSVYVTSIPGQGTESLLGASETLRKAGLIPIPHIAARAFQNDRQLDALLSSLKDAGVERLLVLGGDIKMVAGPFASSRQLLESRMIDSSRFKAVGFATYPERHPHIDRRTLDSELRAKLHIASELGLGSWLVSQLCFDTAATIRHVETLRLANIRVPIHIGFTGPTSWRGMLKFAAICGVSASTRSLGSNAIKVGRLMSGFNPADPISNLAAFSADNVSAKNLKPHFFTFGGAAKTAAWINAFSNEFHRVSATAP